MKVQKKKKGNKISNLEDELARTIRSVRRLIKIQITRRVLGCNHLTNKRFFFFFDKKVQL